MVGVGHTGGLPEWLIFEGDLPGENSKGASPSEKVGGRKEDECGWYAGAEVGGM